MAVVVQSATGTTAATCAEDDACAYGYALSLTPVLLSTSPSSGNEGDTLTVTGHTLSLTPADTLILIDGAPCEVTSATLDTSFTPPACAVATCTQEMQTVVALTCTLPHLSSVNAHTVSLAATATGGLAPALAGATLTTPPVIRSFSPASGSVAGGTVLTLHGDGFSPHKAHLEVTLGGLACRVMSANESHVQCIAPVAANLTADSDEAISLAVAGTTASCTAGACTFGYRRAQTPIITAANVTAAAADQWTIELSGAFGSGSDFPAPTVMIGGTECLVSSVTNPNPYPHPHPHPKPNP